MPRGVEIPDLREQLFQAAERLMARDGPGGLSSRAITGEAGCAKGILHNHFADLDGFLAEFVVSRFHRAHLEAARLPALAGRATVAQNVFGAIRSLFGSNVLGLASLVTRPGLMRRMHEQSRGGARPSLAAVERGFAAYLNEEKKLGRVAAQADTDAISLALVAVAHHLFFAGRHHTGDPDRRLRRVVDVLIGPVTPKP